MAYPGYQPAKSNNPFSSGQTGARRASVTKADISRDLDIARGRKEFFSNRPDVSDNRALRRMKQADETQRFKNLYTKPVTGSSNLLQMTADAPRSLAQERIRLANMYGPTFKEIGSDIAFGLGSMAKGIAEKGTPLMQLGKGILGGIGNFLAPFNPMPAINTGIQNFQTGFNNFMQSGQNFNTLLMGLPPYQRRVYDMEIMKPGMTREEAYRTAIRTPKMASGGIATFN